MTQPEIKTQLENAGALDVYFGDGVYDMRGSKMMMVFYRLQLDTDIRTGLIEAKLIQTNWTENFDDQVTDRDFEWVKSKPDILKTPPTVTPPRDFHYTDTQIVSGFGGVLNGLSAVKVLSKRRSGDEDEVTVRYEVTADDNLKVYDMTLMLWTEGGSPEFRVISDTGPGPTPV